MSSEKRFFDHVACVPVLSPGDSKGNVKIISVACPLLISGKSLFVETD